MFQDDLNRPRRGAWPATGLALLLILLAPVILRGQFYNGSQLTFGKSRVQYGEFLWQHFRFERFDTYFYLNGRELAQYTAEYADRHIREIELTLQSNLEQKIQFILFNSLSDLKQSNIGLFGDQDYYNTGGVTRIVGGSVLLYFDGSYEHLDRQIRAGIAQVILNGMIYGTGIGAQIKNNALFTVPEWYMNGLISFVSRKWDPEIENQVRDAIVQGRYGKFNSLSGDEAMFAGHSLWNYVAAKYGSQVIPNIVYMARLSRNVEKGFQYVLGTGFKAVVQEWLTYYRESFARMDSGGMEPRGVPVFRKNKPERVYRSLRINPDGTRIAYVTHQLGIYKVFIRDTETGRTRRVFRGGYRLADRPDYTYPMLAWHPTGEVLAFVTERQGQTWLCLYDVAEKNLTRQKLVDFQKVLDISYSGDGSRLVMSVVQKGQSDIVVYSIASGSYEQITKDRYDDHNPRFIHGSAGIIFSSNRVSDTLRFDPPVALDGMGYYNDLFLYDYTRKKSVLQRLTNTPDVDETRPADYGEGHFCYLGDRNGVVNRYLARYDSAIAYIDTVAHYRYFTTTWPVTNYNRNILEQDVSVTGAKYGEVVYTGRNYRMYLADLTLPRKTQRTEPGASLIQGALPGGIAGDKKGTGNDSLPRRTEPFRASGKQRFTVVRRSESRPAALQPGATELRQPADVRRPATDSAGRWTEFTHPLSAGMQAQKDSINKYQKAKQFSYDVEYFIDQMVTQVDFTYLNFAYQPFTGSASPVFVNPGLNALLMVGVTDLMEDYRISGGIRLNVNLINNEYLFSYGNYRRRLDHQLVFHRKSVEEAGYYSMVRHRIHELYYVATYPFNPVLNLKGTASVRYDRAVFLSTDQVNLREPDLHSVWGSLKGELTYDNTRSLGLNLFHGTRYKLFGEYYQMVNTKGNHLVVLGLDIRNYQKLHRTLIWANRFAASTSFGSNRLLYYMGGVDNWLFPSYNTETPVAFDQNYAFQTLATNMRGFGQNIRNGNSFFVYNTELRWPLFRYLFNRPIRSDFINNFQVVLFGDIGTAWTGTSPWSADNQLFVRYINSKPLFIKVEMQKDPLVEGFGFGARTRLFGYFLRGDMAWGVEDGRIRKPVFYISLSLDF